MIKKLLTTLLVVSMLIGSLAACNLGGGDTDDTTAPGEDGPLEFVDYASTLTLDMTSSTLKQVVTVKQHIDGDTTHFNVPTSVMPDGVFKARYLAINTPESTGQIEEWGKAASNYTKNALTSAVSIIIESDNGKWNADSTGGRYLVWVWYKTEANGEYRNLNLEILQNGLAIASNSAQNRYGELCMSAINQAKAHKLYVYSGEKDPDFYYGSAIELTIKEIRANPEKYTGKTVAFEGVITKNSGQSVYVEEYNDETGMYHGISVYYGYNLNGIGLGILSVGNRVRIVGSMQYYEAGGTYQISDVSYDMMDPTAAENIQKISSGHSPAYVETTASLFTEGKVSISYFDENGEELIEERDYAEMALATSIKISGLTVRSASTTNNGGDSDGAITLICESADGKTVKVRTSVMKDANGDIITEDFFIGKTMDVRGIVDYFYGDYQVKVFSMKDILFAEE